MLEFKQQQDLYIEGILEAQKTTRSKKPIFREELRHIISKVDLVDRKIKIDLKSVRTAIKKINIPSKSYVDFSFRTGNQNITSSRTSDRTNINTLNNTCYTYKPIETISNILTQSKEKKERSLTKGEKKAAKVAKEYTYKPTDSVSFNIVHTGNSINDLQQEKPIIRQLDSKSSLTTELIRLKLKSQNSVTTFSKSLFAIVSIVFIFGTFNFEKVVTLF